MFKLLIRVAYYCDLSPSEASECVGIIVLENKKNVYKIHFGSQIPDSGTRRILEIFGHVPTLELTTKLAHELSRPCTTKLNARK